MTIRVLTLAGVIALSAVTSLVAQSSAIAVATTLNDGNAQLVTFFDNDSSSYKTYNISKHGTRITVTDNADMAPHEYDVRQNSGTTTVFDYGASAYRTYAITRTGNQLRVFDYQTSTYRNVSIGSGVTAAQTPPSGTTAAWSPYRPCPAGNGWSALGCALQEMSRTMQQSQAQQPPRNSSNAATGSPIEPKMTLPRPDPRFARVYVYRPAAKYGFLVSPSVYVDGLELTKLPQGQFFWITVPAGEHSFTSNDGNTAVSLELDAGKVAFVKVSVVSGGFVHGGRGAVVRGDDAEGLSNVATLIQIPQDTLRAHFKSRSTV